MGSVELPSGGPETPEVRVLLVDDSPTNLRVTGAMLKRLGCEVVTAESGEEALEIAGKEPAFGLILLDYQMPGLSGADTARALNERLGAEAPPLIALTGDVDLEVFRACRDAGMRLVLRKPIPKEHLSIIVDRIRVGVRHA